MIKIAVFTPHSLAKTACRRWRDQYGYDRGRTLSSGKTPADVADALEALGTTPDPEAVDAAIGNPSWTTPDTCDGCGLDDRSRRLSLSGERGGMLLCDACARGAADALIAELERTR